MPDTDLTALRATEFARLDTTGNVYLDHTGSALYPDVLVREHANFLRASVLGNPHSRNPTARASTEIVDAARARILSFFRADPAEYDAIFTANASHALKLVGESYPFCQGSRLCLTADNHNSVNGIREFAASRGADTRYLTLDSELRVADLEAQLAGADRERPNLFGFPAQSNFSGVQHPLAWIERAHALGYDVLLDAAAFVPTNRLDLGTVKPDFVAISFYKMFGFPTGIGALLARRDALAKLRRPWFGGGTVRFAAAQQQVHIPYRTAAAFEDGTLNFLDIAAVPRGLDFLDDIGIERVHDHVTTLFGTLLESLRALVHANGQRMVRIYGPDTTCAHGATVAINLLDAGGRMVDCRHVETDAAAVGISLRTGYFCNPGAAETSFAIPVDEARRCFAELAGDDFTLQQFSACLHDRPVGAIRLSLGLSSSAEDVRRGVELLATCATCHARD